MRNSTSLQFQFLFGSLYRKADGLSHPNASKDKITLRLALPKHRTLYTCNKELKNGTKRKDKDEVFNVKVNVNSYNSGFNMFCMYAYLICLSVDAKHFPSRISIFVVRMRQCHLNSSACRGLRHKNSRTSGTFSFLGVLYK